MERRIEYWNHFIEAFFVGKEGGGSKVTGPRLRRIKLFVLKDNNFWFQIIDRHDGLGKTPDQMKAQDKRAYDHAMGNFWGEINRMLVGDISQ
jgi:hypothetical protein